MFTRVFLRRTAERALKTAAQAFLVAAGLGEPLASVISIGWVDAAGIAAAVALASVLTSIVSAPVGPADSPSVVD